MAGRSPTRRPARCALTGRCWRPTSAMPETVLVASGIEAGYPNKQILFGVDFAIADGEVVALLGANGSGKSTALNTVSGFVRPWAGSIRLEAAEIGGQPPHRIFKHGIIQ